MPIKASQIKEWALPGVTFVETGTDKGNGIKAAIEAGFDDIVSIELDSSLYQFNKRQFQDNPNVKIYQGDSGKVLPLILPYIKHAFFWLDAHSDENTAIKGELEAIKGRNGETVMIDDFRYYRNGYWKGKDLILSVMSDVWYMDGYQKDDILVGIL